MRRTKNIENLSGRGRVHLKDGKFVGNAEYLLQIRQEYRTVQTDDGTVTIPGRQRVHGMVVGLDSVALMRERAVLTLYLDGGRCLDFQFADLAGLISASGGPYDFD